MATYTVKAGDNLTKIARQLGLSSYTQLSGYNKSNPNLIYPGTVLTYNSPAQASSTKPAAVTPTSTPTPSTGTGFKAAPTTTNPAQLQQNIQAASIQPTAPFSDYMNQAKAAYDPNGSTTQALTTNLQAQLKQQLAAGQAQTAQQLASQGFFRSGQQITSNSLQNTIAESNLALQQAGYTSALNQQENAYAQQLQNQAYATNQQNAQTALQNQVTAQGLTQQDFTNQLNLQAQNFSQWYQTQGLDESLFSSVPASYNTLLTMNNTISPELYNQFASWVNSLSGQY